MKQTIKTKPRLFGIIAIMIVVMITGFIMIYKVFNQYENLVLKNSDSQLIGLTRSVDRSIESYLNRFADSLVHATGDKEMTAAERVWLDEGDSSVLIDFLQREIVDSDKKISTVLVMKDNWIVLSTNGRKDYHFLPLAGKNDGQVAIRPCLGEDQVMYLAFRQEMEDGIEYAVLIDMLSFYEYVAGNLTTAAQDRIMLLDAGGQTYIHRLDGETKVDQVRELNDENCQYEALTFLLKKQSLEEEGTSFYDALESETGKSYRARMAVVPAVDSTNGVFAVGVSTNYDQVIQPLRGGAVQLAVYGSMIVVCILILLAMLLYMARGNQRALKELEILREKNAAMEELNEQTQKFAHHQRLEIMGVLASGISHEFNNLLTPIMGYSMLVLEKLPQDDEEIYDDVLEIYNTSLKAKNVIARLSDIFRKNASTVFKDIVVDHLAEKVSDVARPSQPHHVTIDAQLNCGDLQIYGNETQLSQLLLNLILNSFDAMEARENGVLTVKTEYRHGRICLSVGDNGCGIPENVRPHVFDPFYTTKDARRGTGLGLAIVWQVVEDHNAKIDVKSREGEGTIITVEFPMTKKGKDL